jgi:hypothetical protein
MRDIALCRGEEVRTDGWRVRVLADTCISEYVY